MSVFDFQPSASDRDEAPGLSWDKEEDNDLQEKRWKIPRIYYVAVPRVIKQKCQCGFKQDKHTNFYSCWFDRVCMFIQNQKMAEYVDEIEMVDGHHHDTKVLRIICTKQAAIKLVYQAPNIGGMYPTGQKE